MSDVSPMILSKERRRGGAFKSGQFLKNWMKYGFCYNGPNSLKTCLIWPQSMIDVFCRGAATDFDPSTTHVSTPPVHRRKFICLFSCRAFHSIGISSLQLCTFKLGRLSFSLSLLALDIFCLVCWRIGKI